MILRLIRLFLLAVALGSVSTASETLPKSDESRWVPPSFQKVVGFRFRLPSEGTSGPVPSGFSLLKNGTVDVERLEKLKQKSAELTAIQASKLLSVVNGKAVIAPAACYDPHHIFLFYSREGSVVAAVEVCFSCTGISTMPGISEKRWYRHDFVALARLTDELGLWRESRTVNEWEKVILSNRK